MSSFERKLERINCLIERLRSESSSDVLVVVEGEKDARTLKAIGVESEILTVKSHGRNLTDVVDKIISTGDKEIILLMDFDRHGRELTERLTKILGGMKVKLNLNFWREFSSLLNNDLKDVEGLAKYIETLRRKSGKSYSNSKLTSKF
jgi:5S rRNA maturation endonuclease (ribonuclease M5)